MSKNSDMETISSAAARWVARRDAGLSAAEAAELEQWLAADARHKVAFQHYARAWSALDRLSLAGAQGTIMREIQTRARRRRARRMRVAAAGACAAVVLVFAALWQRPREDAVLNPLQLGASAAGAVVASPERRVLEDGSAVELRQGAVIDVQYDDASRRVVLVSGEAYFQVAKGLPRPFVVVAGDVEVRAVGTAFAVELGREQMEVWVTEGHVVVEKPAIPPDGEAEETIAMVVDTDEEASPFASAADVPVPVATLGECEYVVVKTAPWATEPVVTPVTPAEISKRLTWRISRLEFSATPLAEAVALINRYSQSRDGGTNVRLVMDKSLSALASEPVSGYFHANDIETFVRVLGLSMGIEGQRRGDDIILSKTKK